MTRSPDVVAGLLVLVGFLLILTVGALISDHLARLGDENRTQAEIDALEEWYQR